MAGRGAGAGGGAVTGGGCRASAVPQVSVVVPTRDRPGPLSACLAALEAQDAPSFEVVVVDDGSRHPAAVAAVVAAAPAARLVRGKGQGPAAARNLGASVARAPVLCFTDDDCRPGPGWVAALARHIGAGADAVAGPTRNGRPDDACAVASQTITNHLSEASLDASGHLGFAPTSNLACRAELHRGLRFDESFPLAAGEDRDWCTRLTSRGVPLAYAPEAWVDHHQDLTLQRYWRQQVRYGRGANRGHRNREPGARLAPARFYVELLGKGWAEGPRAGALVVLAQVATAVGIVREAGATRRRT
jgi:glycosyltransferase involved in cell wall biosynthesis